MNSKKYTLGRKIMGKAFLWEIMGKAFLWGNGKSEEIEPNLIRLGGKFHVR